MDFDTLFNQICSDLGKNGDVKEISSQFSSCATDCERISFVLGLEKVKAALQERITITKQEISRNGKSQDLSTSHRIEGNAYYKKKLNSKALNSYNRSLLVGEGEAVALAYANRSAVFYDTADWLHSLRDIQLAFDQGYPRHLEHKLRERQGNCWLKLGNASRAFLSFSTAKDLLNSSSSESPPQDKISSIVAKLENLGDVIFEVTESMNVKRIEQDVIKTRRSAPELNRARNNLLPCASTSIELADSPGRGRCLIATEDLKLGTNIIVEKAFSSVLLEEFQESHCHHCLHWTPGPVPCHQCSQVGFCSTICRDEAWASYHQSECGLTDLLHRAKVGNHGLLALRTVLKVDRQILANVRDESPLDCVYDSTDYGTIHRLVGNTCQRSVADLFRRAVMAVYLTSLIRQGDPDPLLASTVLRLLQSFPCNAHEIAHIAVPPPSAEPCKLQQVRLTEIGSAAMPVLSLINHSCDPNVTRVCYGDVVVVKVIRPIGRGEEILDNYGYHFAIHERSQRQSKLESQYYFRCNCPPCAQDWPLYGETPRLGSRADLSDAFLKDMDDYMTLPCYPNDQSKLEEYASKFMGYIDAIEADPLIRLPVWEYNGAQEAMKHCFVLLATLSPHVEPPTC